MRSSRDCVGTIVDPIDSSAVFSLSMVGRERLIAGGATHGLLKFFDLRMIGGRVYDYRHASSSSPASCFTPATHDAHDSEKGLQVSGWSVFARDHSRKRWSSNSPVYSLSRPSPASTSLYVGLENHVMHFNFTSVSDQHPDPVFSQGLIRNKSGQVNPVKSWDQFHRVVDLSMYDQEGVDRTNLKYQRSIRDSSSLSSAQRKEHPSGLDDRWNTVDKERGWSIPSHTRTQVRQIPRRHATGR